MATPFFSKRCKWMNLALGFSYLSGTAIISFRVQLCSQDCAMCIRAYKKNSRILSLKPLCINFVKSVLFRGAPNPASAIEIRHNVSDVNIAVATIGVLPYLAIYLCPLL